MAIAGNDNVTTSALLHEAREEFARVRAMLERRYQREGRRLLQPSDVREASFSSIPHRAPNSPPRDDSRSPSTR